MPYVHVNVDWDDIIDDLDSDDLVKEVVERLKKDRVKKEDVDNLRRALNMQMPEKQTSLDTVMKYELFDEVAGKYSLYQLQTMFNA